FYYIPVWWIVFLLGGLFGTIYCIKNTKFVFESVKINEEFIPLLKETLQLVFSNGISYSFGYLDRFLIMPIINATAMSVYHSVSIFSKILNMLIVPFNNVLLSYLARISTKNSKRKLASINIGIIILLIPTYFMLNYLNHYLLYIYYPNFLDYYQIYIY